MELLVCFMFIVVMLVQLVGLLAIYQLLAKNTNKQIERQTEYLEAFFVERFNGFSSTIRHTELCQTTCQEPTVKCGTSPEADQHNESLLPDEDENMSSDDVDEFELPTDIAKDCPVSVEYSLDEKIQSPPSRTNDLPFSLNIQARSEDVILNDSLDGKKALKNVKIILNGNTKIERQVHIYGAVNGLAIGDKNTVAAIDNVILDKHQSRDNQRRCKPYERGYKKKQTPPDMKRGRKIKDPMIKEAVNKTQQNQEQGVPSSCNKSEITQAVQKKQPSSERTWLEYLEHRDDSLFIEDENKLRPDIFPNDNLEENPYLEELFCKKSCYDRLLSDMSDIDEGNIFNGYLIDDQYNSASRESYDVIHSQGNVPDSCDNNTNNSCMGTLKSCNRDDGNSKMLASGVPHEGHCHCNSCRFLMTVAEKLGGKTV